MRRYVLPLLSLYLDFILVNAFVTLASFFLGRAWGYVAGVGAPWYAEIGLSVVLVGLARALGVSALAVLAVSTLSLVLSWRVLPEAIARVQAARREMQGLPLREGEVEAMQAMLPWLAAGGLVLILLLLALSRERQA